MVVESQSRVAHQVPSVCLSIEPPMSVTWPASPKLFTLFQSIQTVFMIFISSLGLHFN